MAPTEIQFVANYLTNLLVASEQQPFIYLKFTNLLTARFVPLHWHPLDPERGSGYRAVSFDPTRQDGYLDPVLAMLAQLIGSNSRQFRRTLVQNFGASHSSGWTIWCDPGCVSMRLQASAGELRELWGVLPSHLSIPRSTHSPSSFPALSHSSPIQSPSPNKSRAIPILAPQGTTKLNVIPPTPLAHDRHDVISIGIGQDVEADCHDLDGLADHSLQASFKISTYCPSSEDPFLRPSSRTSCASSSSDGSDHSGFSSSSSSTATSIAPLGSHVKKSLALVPVKNLTRGNSAYVRHYSSNSVPFVSMNSLPSVGLVPLSSLSNTGRRAASPAYSGPRRRHGASSSISSGNNGRGLLVFKEGPGTVTEHSGGKVGVMGGGVLLGLPKDKESVAVVSTNTRRMPNRRTRTGPANL